MELAVLLVDYILLPILFITSIVYIFGQKRWRLFLLTGAIGMAAAILLCRTANLIVAAIGFMIGVAYPSFFMQPTNRRVGAAVGWLFSMICGTAYLYGSDTGAHDWNENPHLHFLADMMTAFFSFGALGGAIGAYFGKSLKFYGDFRDWE